MKITGWLVCAVLGMSVSLAAQGQGNVAEVVAEGGNLWNAGMAEVRAGPDESFPAVGALRNGELVRVHGCVEDYQWCDISDDSLRGWMHASHLTYRAQNQTLLIADHGPSLALPVLTFVLAAYWADYYRDRHWYHNHSHWNNWHYRPRPPNFGLPSHRPPHLQPRPPRPPHLQPRPPRPPQGARPPAVRPPNNRPPHAGNGSNRPDARPPQRPQRPANHARPGRNPDRERGR